MFYGNNVPGEPQLGGFYPMANDFDLMTLAMLDGRSAGSYFVFIKMKENDDGIFR